MWLHYFFVFIYFYLFLFVFIFFLFLFVFICFYLFLFVFFDELGHLAPFIFFALETKSIPGAADLLRSKKNPSTHRSAGPPTGASTRRKSIRRTMAGAVHLLRSKKKNPSTRRSPRPRAGPPAGASR